MYILEDPKALKQSFLFYSFVSLAFFVITKIILTNFSYRASQFLPQISSIVFNLVRKIFNRIP